MEWVLSDFKAVPTAATEGETLDVVISSYALHHLNAQEKLTVLKSAVHAMKPGGWLLNADIVVAAAPNVERRIQEIRVEAVTDRAPRQDTRFCGTNETRKFLDDLEQTEQDKPLTLDEDLRILRESGIADAEVFWKEHREAVVGGPKTAA